MAKLSDTEVYNRIREFEDFKKEAEPLLRLIPEIKKTQDDMVTANAVSEATEEQRYDKIAKKAVSAFQQSGWYRMKQISLFLLVAALVVLVISQSVNQDTGTVDYNKLIETIKELAK